MSFYSHPEKYLIQHLMEVYDINKDKIDSDYKKCYKIISLTHDFGKFTTYFQDYLMSKRKNKYSDHGFVSAVFSAYCCFIEFGDKSTLPLIAYSTVLHHHGDIENISKDLPKMLSSLCDEDFRLKEKIEIAKIQIDDIVKNLDEIKNEYKKADFENFIDVINRLNVEDILKKLRRQWALVERSRDEKLYFIHQMLYSALISADKLSASGTDIPEEKYAQFNVLNRNRLDLLGESDLEINKIRSDIFDKIQRKLEKNYQKSRTFTITAPTGTGKTYAGFFAALKLKELLKEDRRIIYSLPFTSIIDQSFDSISKLFYNIQDFKNESSRYLMKHHSIANVVFESKEYDYDNLQAELLMENWSSGIVITTFVQLIETLIGSRNRMLKKLVSLKGSIVLLDEVQAIDISLLPLVDFVLKRACEYYDLRIIMMTATKPSILNDAIELFENNEEYFRLFNRTKLICDLNRRKVSDFIEEFKNNLKDKSYLIVCNTINSSLEVFNSLKDLDRDVFYLSTNLIPKHRRERINEIRDRLKKGEKIILVSTQVVEAGVDLDFDVVIRDIGPIDSIIQCAGRCNRNGLKEIGDVLLYSLVKDEDEKDNFGFGKYVYGTTTLEVTRSILKDDVYLESQYFEIVSEYFKKIQENKAKDKSEKFIKSIKSMNFSEDENDKLPIRKFSLIQDNQGYMDAFVVYDDIAKSALEKYDEMLKMREYLEKRKLYLEIKNVLRDYTISVPIKYHGIFKGHYGLFVLPNEGIIDYYKEDTGFVREEKSFDIF